MTSYHPQDVANKYCGNCHWWTSDPQLGPLYDEAYGKIKYPRIGMTGTRKGMTLEQKATFFQIIFKNRPLQFHHGDCIGADSDGHYQARVASRQIVALGGQRIWIVGHVPDKDKTRAFCKVDEAREPLPYLVRDKNIVTETELLLACPADFIEIVRSGTWTTVRYAREQLKPIIIIRPDGSTLEENIG